MNELTRRTQALKARERLECLAHLKQAGKVREGKEKTGGTPKTILVAI